jgi:Insertion element 4 transposase N-terminal/Transposase DDE domain
MPREKMTGRHVNELLVDLNQATALKHIPLSTVQDCLDRLNLNSRRVRSLPAASIIYLIILMSLHSDVSILEVLRVLLRPIRRKMGINNSSLPVGSAIVRARHRLGVQVFADLFNAIAKPLAAKKAKGCFWKNYRMVAVDGTSQSVHATKENHAFFGCPRSSYGETSNPKVRVVALMECGTKVFFAVSHGSYKQAEVALFQDVIHKLDKDMVLFADRIYYSFASWQKCKQKAGALIWRAKKPMSLKPIKLLEDGSYLAEIKPHCDSVKKDQSLKGMRDIVRVVKFKPVFEDGSQGAEVRLITTILSVEEATAREIAEAYPARWLIEEGFRELKTCLGRSRNVLRSLVPEFVIQELFGFFLMHYIVRRLMYESACQNDISPNDISFTGATNIISHHIISFSPSTPEP